MTRKSCSCGDGAHARVRYATRVRTSVIGAEGLEESDERVDAEQVAVLVVPLEPGRAVRQLRQRRRQRRRLGEVDHPDVGAACVVVHEQ